jgi:hypothetical protein
MQENPILAQDPYSLFIYALKAPETKRKCKELHLYGYEAYEDAWVNMTQEEIDYYRSKTTHEERYQTLKETWYFHETSSYMTGDTSLDRYGCNADACISECDFYPEYGRIENDGHITH